MPDARRKRAAMVALAVAVAPTTMLAACGGSASPSHSAGRQQVADQDAETKLADYARCLREHGVDAEVVSHTDGGRGIRYLPSEGGFAAAVAAGKACARYQPPAETVNVSPKQKIEQEETSRRFAKCLRSHGIHLPAGQAIDTGGGNQEVYMRGVNVGSPAFQAAAHDCGGPKG